MNKLGVLVLVALLGFISVLQMHNRREDRKRTASDVRSSQAEESLPAEASDPVRSEPVAGSLGLPPMVSARPEAKPAQQEETALCAGGTTQDVIASHGKKWGRFVPVGHAVTPDSVNRIYSALSRYLSCKAVAQGNVSLCGMLPSGSQKGKTPDFKRQCLTGASMVLFSAYVTGKSDNLSFCETLLDSDEKPSTISKAKFCSAAAKGVSQFCGDPMFSGQQCPIPVSESACKGDIVCLAEHNTFRAIKENNPMLCQGERSAQCQAFLTKSLNPCLSLAREVGMAYCTYMNLVEDSKQTLNMGNAVRKSGGAE